MPGHRSRVDLSVGNMTTDGDIDGDDYDLLDDTVAGVGPLTVGQRSLLNGLQDSSIRIPGSPP